LNVSSGVCGISTVFRRTERSNFWRENMASAEIWPLIRTSRFSPNWNRITECVLCEGRNLRFFQRLSTRILC